MFDDAIQEIDYNSPKELIDWLMGLIKRNRRMIDDIKGY